MHAYIAESRRGVYLITCDVINRLQSFRSKGFNVPSRNHPTFRSFHGKFLREVQRILPDAFIKAIDMGDLLRNVQVCAEELLARESSCAVVSTCSDLVLTIKGNAISINRLFDHNGELIGYGPRPGFKDLDSQVRELSRRMSSRPVILAEDGVFTGKTLCFILEKLATFGVNVSKIIVGFCCAKAEATIRERFTGDLVVIRKINGLIDWIPDHDLVPFVPYCGRVLGKETFAGFMPVVAPEGASYAYPYIMPFGNFGEWASLPAVGALELSRFCLDASIELFSCIARNSGKKEIMARELVGQEVQVSLPISIDLNYDVPSLDTGVISLLKMRRGVLG